MRAFQFFAILCTVCGSAGNLAHAQPSEGSRVPVTVYNFCASSPCVDGAFVYPAGGGSLIQAPNGGLYGTTWAGGTYGYGTIFGIDPRGKLITQYNFCAESGCPDGSNPYFGLVLAASGDLYGITTAGGAHGQGTVFEFTRSGRLITLHSFSGGADGGGPYAGLVLATDGELYGSTRSGGSTGNGTIFGITLSGKLTTLYNFTGGADGSAPQATLVQGTHGDLFGTTYSGGTGNGTIFRITLSGKLSTLHAFDGSDGGASQAGFVQATNGNLYGTGKFGGGGNGTIYKITTDGTLYTLHDFDGSDGTWPNSALIQATDGNLYGTTEIGGASGTGTIFMITPNGKLTVLYEFGSEYGGGENSLYAGLVQATNGEMYGTTERGGTADDGTVFRFQVGLGPFVETQPTSGAVGASIEILGTSLAGATGVTFNGTPASFTIVSASEIQTTVPAGATSGTVEVTMPSGTLSSNVVFTVTPTPALE